MWQGTIESINIADSAKAPMRALVEVRAIPGVGLEGDRYARQQGTFYKPEPDYELTLIEAEAIEALSRDCAIELPPGDARRNLVTRGVPLNHLVAKEFFIGDVKIRGLRLCEPCWSHKRPRTNDTAAKIKNRASLFIFLLLKIGCDERRTKSDS